MVVLHATNIVDAHNQVPPAAILSIWTSLTSPYCLLSGLSEAQQRLLYAFIHGSAGRSATRECPIPVDPRHPDNSLSGNTACAWLRERSTSRLTLTRSLFGSGAMPDHLPACSRSWCGTGCLRLRGCGSRRCGAAPSPRCWPPSPCLRAPTSAWCASSAFATFSLRLSVLCCSSVHMWHAAWQTQQRCHHECLVWLPDS